MSAMMKMMISSGIPMEPNITPAFLAEKPMETSSIITQKSLPVRKLSVRIYYHAKVPASSRRRLRRAGVRARWRAVRTPRARDRGQSSRALQDVRGRVERDPDQLRRSGRLRPPGVLGRARDAGDARSAF